MKLRNYQKMAIDMTYSWIENNPGNVCLQMPTGSGKSLIIAALCQDALTQWPETRILMMTHVKELIEQNSEKLRTVWPNAPLGIYSSGIGRKDLDQPITFAGIQSIRNRSSQIGFVDLIIIDECHLVSHNDEGGYRKLISELTAINPRLRVIGLTATPWRLGHGMITDAPAIFNDLIQPVGIIELITEGYLAPLRSKLTDMQIDVSKVKKRGGEYIESELQAAVDHIEITMPVVDEVIARAGDRKAWLFFCTGVDHAKHVADALNSRNIPSACVHGGTPKKERDALLAQFKSGEIKAMTNANILTTGFDYPDIDLIAFLRPTLSPSLYVQMAGRGMRLKSHTDHCLVLDFAGLVKRHGPITAVKPPSKAGKGDGAGDAPVKVCQECEEILHVAVKKCPCGYEFPIPDQANQEPTPVLHNQDIMKEDDLLSMDVSAWSWAFHFSKSSGKEMLKTTYYGNLSDPPITEYFPVQHGGHVGERAIRNVLTIAKKSGIDPKSIDDELVWASDILQKGKNPSMILYRKNGKFFDVKSRIW
jgi:DNA repair protein RadD